MRTLSAVVIGVSLCGAVLHAQNSVIASGAVDAYNAAHTLHVGATIGQPVIGTTLAASAVNYQGFWHPMPDAASSVEITHTGTPMGFTLEQNYPNPFTPSTLIRFSIQNSAHTVLRVYTLTGELVTTLMDSKLDAGTYSLRFDGSSMASGTYLYSLETDGKTITKQMTIMK